MARNKTWWTIGAGSLAALLMVGCQGSGQQEQEQQAQAPAEQAEQAQEQAEQRLEEAQRAQEQAATEQEDVGSAQEDVAQAREEAQQAEQELAEAQQEAQQERQQAIQAQEQAQAETQQAQQAAEARQEEALQAQQEMGPGAATGGAVAAQGQQTVSGQLVEVTEEEIRVGPESGNEVRLQVNEQTQVMRDGQMASLQELQPGTQVRASYELQEGEPVVTRLEATSSGSHQQ
ncbi:hypothetical protein [Vulgatibacter sp.]|uniref:hypothetical protein n=1 Tax=Vulgatibacter sp. TaxID=1971226 RepID=UPI00356571A5